MTTKVKGLLKGLRYISQIFDDEEEQEMVIGFPTDVKHVAHIGMDGPSNAPPSWMNEFKQPQAEGDPNKEDTNSKVTDGNSVHRASEGSSRRGAKANGYHSSPSRDLPEVPKPSHHPSSSSTGAESPTKAKLEKRRHARRASKGSPGRDFLDPSHLPPDMESSLELPAKAKSEKPRHSRHASKGSSGRVSLEQLPSDAGSESGLDSPRKLPDIPKKTRRKKSKDSDGSTRRSKHTSQASPLSEEPASAPQNHISSGVKPVKEGDVKKGLDAVS